MASHLFEEANRLNLYEKYLDNASVLGVSFEVFYKAVNILLESDINLSFDERYLKPTYFKIFCSLLDIPVKKLCEEFAALCNLNPVTIGKFENGLKYPSRKQHAQLKEVMKL